MLNLPFKHRTLAFTLAAGATLMAQTTTGNLSGVITDTAGKPLAGIRISLHAAELIGTRTLTTDDKGRYRAHLLPVSTYTIKVSSPDYLGKTARGIRVGLGAEAEVDFRLAPIAILGAKVEVVSSVQSVESVDTATVSTNLSMETMQMLAVERTTAGALLLTPGYNIEGIRGSYNTGFTLNGIETRDPKKNMALYDTVPEAVEEIQVVLSPMHARYGRTLGGMVNTVTKSGSNQFMGSLTVKASRPSWVATRQGTNLPASSAASLMVNLADDLTRTYNWTFGGPIIKDRIWFFASGKTQPDSGSGTLGTLKDFATQRGIWQTYGVSPLWTLTAPTGNATRASASIDNYLQAGPGGAYVAGGTDLMDSGYTYAKKTSVSQQDLKLTGVVNENNVVTLAMFRTKLSTMSAPSGAQNLEMVGENNENAKGFNLGWKGVFGNNLSAELNYTKTDRESLAYAGPTDNPVSVIAAFAAAYSPTLSATNRLNSLGYASVLRSTNPNWPEGSGVKKIDGNLKYFVDYHGSHDLDLGFDVVKNYDSASTNFGSSNQVIYTGGYYRDPSKSALDASAFLFPTMAFSGLDRYGNLRSSGDSSAWGQVYGPNTWNLPIGPAPIKLVGSISPERGRTQASAIYVNDQWTVNSRLQVMLGLRYNTFSGTANSGLRVDNMSRLDPRLMIKWNPRGDNKESFSFTLARYSQEFAVSYFGSGGLSASPYNNAMLVAWKGVSGQLTAPSTIPAGGITNPADYVKFVTYADLLNPDNWDNTRSIAFKDDRGRTKIGKMEVPYADEVALNYTRTITGGSVRISLARKIFRKDWQSYQDTGLLDHYTQAVDPMGSGKTLSYVQNTYWMNNPFHTTYDTLEMGWNQNLTARLFWMGAVTLSRRSIDKNFQDVYNYAYVKALNGLNAANEDTYVSKGLQSETRNMNLGFGYRVPILTGDVTFGLNGTYTLPNVILPGEYGDPSRNTVTFANWPSMTAAAGTSGITEPYRGSYNSIFQSNGSFHAASESYTNWNFKVGFRAPIGFRKACITGSLMIYNIFNQTVFAPAYPSSQDTGAYMGPLGYMLRAYNTSNKVPVGGRGEGTSGANIYISSQPRRSGEVTFGITF